MRTIKFFLRLSSLVWLLSCANLRADEIRPAFLQLTETKAGHFDAMFRVPVHSESERLALDVQFSDAVQTEIEPMGGFDGSARNTYWSISSPGGLAGKAVRITNLERTSTEVLVRIAYLDGATSVHRLTPDAPTYVVEQKATWIEIVATYFVLGVEHILFGIDHLLFVFVLLLLVRDIKNLIATITAFTAAHSITLILASLELVSVPVPPMEATIALSIAFVATEIIRGQQGRPGITARYPWLVAFIFGLLHGLGFAAALGEIGLPQNAIFSALVVFNLGVEAGQLLFVFLVLVAWWGIKRVRISFPVWMERVPPYAIGGVASFWVFERVASFWS